MQIAIKDDKVQLFNLIVSTNRDVNNVHVKGPDFDSKEKMINWGLWLPYGAIANQPTQSTAYVEHYFDALVLVFKTYGITEYKIRAVQKMVEEEVIGNTQYDYDEETLDLDFSDLDFD